MNGIEIVPIFNQSAPGVWYSFADICTATMLTNYNYKMDQDEIDDMIAQDIARWRRGIRQFAFGAYDGAKMVGYIQGKIVSGIAHMDSLYVLHEYQGMHIGTRLLSAAENAAAPFAVNASLISLSDAETFYRAHGYVATPSTHELIKPLSSARCATIPVFWCDARFAHKCSKLNATFDKAEINVGHAPMFACYDIDARLCGYITPHISAQTSISTDITQDMQNAMTCFLANQKKISRC